MKKCFFIISIVILIFALCSCTPAPTKYTVDKNGVTYEINKENKTISDGSNIFKYEFEGNESDYEVNITYPDGSTYWWDMSGVMGNGGWSDGYDPDKYVDGDVLTNILLEDAPKATKHSGGSIIAIILLIALGIFNVAVPHAAWYLEYGWRYKDAEPSDFALGLNRFGGVVAIIIAVIMIFV